MINNPRCLYCGRVMAQRLHNGLWSYKCPECGASSPECETKDEAYAAAMKRDEPANVKPVVNGEWVHPKMYAKDGNGIYSELGEIKAAGFSGDKSQKAAVIRNDAEITVTAKMTRKSKRQTKRLMRQIFGRKVLREQRRWAKGGQR